MTDDRERDLAERIADTIREAHREWMRPGSGTTLLCDALSAAVLPLVRASEAAAVRRALDDAADEARNFPATTIEPDYQDGYRDGREDVAKLLDDRAATVAAPAREQGEAQQPDVQLTARGLNPREAMLRLLADAAETPEGATAYNAAADKERASTLAAREQGGVAE